MAPFSAESPDAPTDLRDSIIAATSNVLKVFLVLVGDPPVVRVIHRPTKFSPTLGVASPWYNCRFVFASDIGSGNQIALVNWPETAFQRTQLVQVPAVADMENQWNAALGADCVGPFDDDQAANTEEIRCRFVVPVPPAYASFVMRHQSFTPQQIHRNRSGPNCTRRYIPTEMIMLALP